MCRWNYSSRSAKTSITVNSKPTSSFRRPHVMNHILHLVATKPLLHCPRKAPPPANPPSSATLCFEIFLLVGTAPITTHGHSSPSTTHQQGQRLLDHHWSGLLRPDHVWNLLVYATGTDGGDVFRSSARKKDVSARYNETAATFDQEIDFTEWVIGMPRLRRQLAEEASGHVLEVSVGTGRNVAYLDLKK